MSYWKQAQRRNFEHRLADRVAKWEALQQALLKHVNPADAISMQHQADELKKEIESIDADLIKLEQAIILSSDVLPPANPHGTGVNPVPDIAPRNALRNRATIFFAVVILVLILFRVTAKTPDTRIDAHYRDPGQFHMETAPLLFCSDSLQDWVDQALTQFRRNGTSLSGNAVPYGARDAKEEILFKAAILTRGGKGNSYKTQGRPVVYMPDDDYWPPKLNADWRDPKVLDMPSDVLDPKATRVLLHSRLIFIMHSNRGEWFANATRTSQYSGKPWLLLHDILERGWQVAEPSATGHLCHLYIADPLKLHAGLAALILMFAEREPGQKASSWSNRPFLDFIGTFAGASTDCEFNSPILMDAVQPGQSGEIGNDDIAIGYESDLYRAIDSGNATGLVAVYPDPTLDIRFCAALLRGRWTMSREQKSSDFIDFMLSAQQQNLALNYGFRPEQMQSDTILFPNASTSIGFGKDTHTVSLQLVPATKCTTDLGSGILTVDPQLLADLPAAWIIAKSHVIGSQGSPSTGRK